MSWLTLIFDFLNISIDAIEQDVHHINFQSRQTCNIGYLLFENPVSVKIQ
jgi:hypothetical protein